MEAALLVSVRILTIATSCHRMSSRFKCMMEFVMMEFVTYLLPPAGTETLVTEDRPSRKIFPLTTEESSVAEMTFTNHSSCQRFPRRQ